MNHKFQLKKAEGPPDPLKSLLGLLVSLAAIVIGGAIAALSWAPVSVGMGSDVVPFVFGSALIIAGVLFYPMFKFIYRHIY